MALKPTSYLEQNLVDIKPIKIPIFNVHVSALNESTLKEALVNPKSRTGDLSKFVGIAYATSQTFRLNAIALTVGHRALVIRFEGVGKSSRKAPPVQPSQNQFTDKSVGGLQVLRDLFSDPEHTILAFDLAPLALALSFQQDLPISSGIDIQDCLPNGEERIPFDALKFAVGDRLEVFKANIESAFKQPYLTPQGENDKSTLQKMISRAWAASYISE
jgi:hypothetical protein